MENKLGKMVDEYFSLEKEIIAEMEKLQEYGEICSCDEPNMNMYLE